MSLDVHLDGRRIGSLERATGTDYVFAYAPDVLSAAGEGAIVLSNSLPVRHEAFGPIETRAFFDGLLPEESRRNEIARELRLDAGDGYALLAEIGRDCAGAVVVVPAGAGVGPGDGSVSWLSGEALEELVERLPTRPLGVQREGGKMRLSLAGVQRKLTLIRSGSGQFGEPRADAPSTHLLKPEFGEEYPGLAHNEVFCMRVARCVGLPVPETELLMVGERPCLLSARFDRSSDGAATVRLHQEDLCQALGVSPNLKYQAHGGPGFRNLRELLAEIGRGADVEAAVRAATCNFVLGNADAHGKNFAILFTEQGRRLAPLYDVVCTAVYDLDQEMAMSIGDSFDPAAVARMDWVDMSHDCDLRIEPFLRLVLETAQHVHECAESVAALSRAEGWHAPVIDDVVEVTRQRSAMVSSEIG